MDSRIVIPNLKGGLGNQLFQIATACGVAADNKCKFALNYDLPHTCIQGHSPTKYKDTLYCDLPITDIVPGYTYDEDGFSYKEIPYEQKMIINGYFQTEKYFVNHKEEVKKLFTFPNHIKDRVSKAFSKLPGKKIGVHIRRGDYKLVSHVHKLCTPEYYREALKVFSLDHASGNCHYILCTDDIDSVREEFDIGQFIVSNSKDELEDLYLLSQCDSVVICNSTFSWWGAWLGKNKDKVICPAEWFGPAGPSDYQDIFAEGWIKL